MNWILQKLGRHYCLARSPEGFICTKRAGHTNIADPSKSLHWDKKGGPGHAWGGCYNGN